MTGAAVGVGADVLLLVLIGLGPALWLCGDSSRVVRGLALAGPLGLAETTLCGTYLTLMDLPVVRWAWAYAFSATAFSLVLCLLATRRAEIGREIRSPDVAAFGVTLIVAAVAVCAPFVVGGLQYVVLRGNGDDAFNYASGAAFLAHVPLSWASGVPAEDLARMNPIYALGPQLVAYRWTAYVVLAWGVEVARVPLNRFEFAFDTVPFVLSVGPVYLLARRAGVSVLGAATLTLAVCAGFWAQYVLDSRAVAQVCSLPLTLGVCCFLSMGPESASRRPVGPAIGLAALTAAQVFLYPEYIPTIATGGTLFVAVSALRDRRVLRRWLMVLGPGLVATLLFMAPHLVFSLRVLLNQLTFAQQQVVDWQVPYFGWFYANPLLGIWGLPDENVAAPVGRWVALVVSAGLSAALVAALVDGGLREASPRRATILLMGLLGGVALGEAGYLYGRDQMWAAGKAVSFGYPFLELAAGMFLATCEKPLRTVGRSLVAVWLAAQLGTIVYRVDLAGSGREWPSYLRHHDYYRAFDWDETGFVRALLARPTASLGVLGSNPWVLQYWSWAAGWQRPVVDVARPGSPPVELLLVDKKAGWNDRVLAGSTLAANNSFGLLPLSYLGYVERLRSGANGRRLPIEGGRFRVPAATEGTLVVSLALPAGIELGHRPATFKLLGAASAQPELNGQGFVVYHSAEWQRADSPALAVAVSHDGSLAAYGVAGRSEQYFFEAPVVRRCGAQGAVVIGLSWSVRDEGLRVGYSADPVSSAGWREAAFSRAGLGGAREISAPTDALASDFRILWAYAFDGYYPVASAAAADLARSSNGGCDAAAVP